MIILSVLINISKTNLFIFNLQLMWETERHWGDSEVCPALSPARLGSEILISLSSLSSFSFVPLSVQQLAGGILKFPPLTAPTAHTNFEMRLMIKFVNYLFVKNFEQFRWFSTRDLLGTGGISVTGCLAWLPPPLSSSTLLIIINYSWELPLQYTETKDISKCSVKLEGRLNVQLVVVQPINY